MDIRSAIKGQYRATLAMLRQTIEQCPDDLWLDDTPTNAYWHVAYHALFYAHLYSQPDEASFTPWDHQREQYQFLGQLPWPPHDAPAIGEPYTKQQLLEYCDHIDGLIDETIDAVDLDAEQCGFWWYDLPKLDHELMSIRHVQHHVGQLAERLRQAADIGTDWIGGQRS
jgi:hypothetical protein